MIVTRRPLVDIDRIRELQDLNNPAAPFNQPDAEYCYIHNQVQCSICKTDKVEWDSEMEEWYCLHCEHFTELVEDVCSE